MRSDSSSDKRFSNNTSPNSSLPFRWYLCLRELGRNRTLGVSVRRRWVGGKTTQTNSPGNQAFLTFGSMGIWFPYCVSRRRNKPGAHWTSTEPYMALALNSPEGCTVYSDSGTDLLELSYRGLTTMTVSFKCKALFRLAGWLSPPLQDLRFTQVRSTTVMNWLLVSAPIDFAGGIILSFDPAWIIMLKYR
jgi:hypothetical protein